MGQQGKIRRRQLLVCAAAATLLVACAGPIKRAERYAAQDEWMPAVLEYRKAYGREPANVEYKSLLKQAELKAADFHYQRGQRLLEQGHLDGAIAQYQHGLSAIPDHSKLLQATNEAVARKEAEALYAEALAQLAAGNAREGRQLLQRVIDRSPGHRAAAASLAQLRKAEAESAGAGLALSSSEPVTLNFRQTDLRTAFEFLAKSFGINLMFDEAFKSVPVTLYAKDVTFEQGLNLLLATSKNFYKKLGPNTILIAPDSKEKRGQYEDHIVRNVQLNSIAAKEMADILKGLLTIKKIIVNEELNSIIIRDTAEVLKLAERLIEANDRKPAEMILEVEILEVNRNKAERLGLDLGSYAVGASVPPFPLTSSFSRALDAGTFTVPSATFRFFRQDVDAKTLANPKIRVLNGKEAKIHIGDRVPLRSATIQDATGQVRTTFDYREIGIRFIVQPAIHLDNSATVKLSLEVSSLGENVGTANEPAFRIGTRNADTTMLLRDGETAILGGLIRDEERSTQVKVPGLGIMPLIGRLFTADDSSAGRTDVLLTITPRVVRGWEPPTALAREFYSGTENVYTTEPLYAFLDGDASGRAPPKIDTSGEALDEAPDKEPPPETTPLAETPEVTPEAVPASLDELPEATASAVPPTLAFAEALYEAASGQELEVQLDGRGLGEARELPIEVLYNPQLLSFVRGEQADAGLQEFKVEADAERGVLRIQLAYPEQQAPPEGAKLARLVLRANKAGVSYLVCRAPALRTVQGEVVNAQVRASRIVIQ